MKKPMKRILLLFTAVLVTGVMFSCKEEGPHKDDIIKFSAVINSDQTVPRVSAAGKGSGVFEYNKVTKSLKYNITYQNVTPTSITLNNASPAWEAGPIQFILADKPTGGQVQGAVTLSTELQTALILGGLYINIPTAENVYGELRGQIIADKVE
ncbi:CHRD domain-containing protein [Dyadobacter tibetensis]|uniref:CHRD domain-containing protein n=1 Tax=Dyadobacter tibetensis TaxID=1211851 RepID=UPI000471EBF0|nr:CHRD domain-containing protein [Dyadobacter tibetensis]